MSASNLNFDFSDFYEDVKVLKNNEKEEKGKKKGEDAKDEKDKKNSSNAGSSLIGRIGERVVAMLITAVLAGAIFMGLGGMKGMTASNIAKEQGVLKYIEMGNQIDAKFNTPEVTVNGTPMTHKEYVMWQMNNLGTR